MDDIRRDSDADWIVVGWFTPDYRPLAEKLAANLDEHGAPYHLYALEPFGKNFYERTRKKPEVVLRAMDDYPGKTIVLMDADCIVKGDISNIADTVASDVGIYLKAEPIRKPRVSMAASSRVVVLRPTTGARIFAETWNSICAGPVGRGCDDELCMVWAFIKAAHVGFDHIPLEYSGREAAAAPANAVIIHSSENGRRTYRLQLRSALKGFEKRFLRTGRTQRREAMTKLG